jgi:hypothetical protein
MLRPGAASIGLDRSAPASADRTHVLAAMAIHLRVVADGGSGARCLALVRRRHYEEEPLDFSRLPAGPALLRLEPLPE